jgi:hypothetical protein
MNWIECKEQIQKMAKMFYSGPMDLLLKSATTIRFVMNGLQTIIIPEFKCRRGSFTTKQ